MIGELIKRARRRIFGLAENEYRVNMSFKVSDGGHVPTGSVVSGDLRTFRYKMALTRDYVLDVHEETNGLPVLTEQNPTDKYVAVPGEFIGLDREKVLLAREFDLADAGGES